MGLMRRLVDAVAPPERKRAIEPRIAPPKPEKLSPSDMKISLENRQLRMANRALTRLERRDPDRFDEIVMDRAHLLPKTPPPKDVNELDTTLSVLERLKRVRLLTEDIPNAGDGGIPQWAQAFLAGIGSNPVIGARIAELMGGSAPSSSQPPNPQLLPPVVSAPPIVTPIAAQPAQLAQLPPPVSAALGVGDVDVSGIVIAQLSGKSPVDAANWLLAPTFNGQPITLPDEARAVAGQLCESPDDQIADVLFRLQERHPEMARLVGWLYANQTWTYAVVHEMRSISGVGILVGAAVSVPAAEEAWYGI